MTASPKPSQRLTLLSAVPTLDQLGSALELARKELDSVVQQPWLIDDKDSYCISVTCLSQSSEPEWTLSFGLAHDAQIRWTYQSGDVGLICNLIQSELTGVAQDTEHVPNTYANLSSISWGDFGEGDPASGNQAADAKAASTSPQNTRPAAAVQNPAPPAPPAPFAAPASPSSAASLFGLPNQASMPPAPFAAPAPAPAAPENPFAQQTAPPNPFASAPAPAAPPAAPANPFALPAAPPAAPPSPFANAQIPPSPAASLFGLPSGQSPGDVTPFGQSQTPAPGAEAQTQSTQAMNAFAAAQANAPANPFAQPQPAPPAPNPFAQIHIPAAAVEPAPPAPAAFPAALPNPAPAPPGFGAQSLPQTADPFAEANDPIAQLASSLAQGASSAFQPSNPFAQALNLPPSSVTEKQKQTVDLAEPPKPQLTNPFAQSLQSPGQLTTDALKETAQLDQSALPGAAPISSNPFAQALTAPSPQIIESQKSTAELNETPPDQSLKDSSTPAEHPFTQRAASAPQNNPFLAAQSNASGSPFGGAPPLPKSANPFADGQSQQTSDNPFANAVDPFAQAPNPFVTPAPAAATAAPSDNSGVKSVKEGPFSGAVKESGFSEILHSIALSKSGGRLSVEDRSLTAELFFEEGIPVHASVLDIKGDTAILELLTWTAGNYQFNPQERAPEQTVRNSLELLIDQGMKLNDRYRELTKVGLKPESYLYRTNPALTEAEFEEHIDKTMALNMNQQKWFYQQIDDRSTLFDILRRHSMPRSQWVPLLLSLVRGTLVEVSDKQVAPGGTLESAGIDKKLVGIAAKSLTNQDTGLVTYPMFLFLLEQEYARFDRNGLPLCTIIFDVAIRQPDGIVPIPNAEVIRQLGNSWKELVRTFDVVAHYQTSQYAMLLPYTDCASAIVVANRVVATLAEIKVDGMERSSFLVACGIAGIPEDCRDPGHLLSASTEALKISKLKGSPVVAYSSLYV